VVVEYILVGIIAFSIGNINGKRKCDHDKEKIVVVHKHKKHRKFRKFGKQFHRKHHHKNHTITMMCHNGWRW